MSGHRHYHHIIASDHRGLGRELGERFGSGLRAELLEATEDPKWRQRLARVPAQRRLAERCSAELVDEVQGFAQAAGCDFDATWAQIYGRPDQPHEGCSTLVTSEGRKVAHNEDWQPAARDWIVVVRKRVAGTEILELYYEPGMGGNAFSANSHGVAQAINSLPPLAAHELEPQSSGLSPDLLARHFSASVHPSRTWRELQGLPRAPGHYAHIWTGPHELTLLEDHGHPHRGPRYSGIARTPRRRLRPRRRDDRRQLPGHRPEIANSRGQN